MSAQIVRTTVVAAVCAMVWPLPGCAMKRRPVETTEALLAERAAGVQRLASVKTEVASAFVRRTDAEVAAASANGERAVYDILLLSGGGDYGAFGAGVLSGWGEIADPAQRRPIFDFVTGISTGALIAPYAFVGTDEAIGFVLDMYSNPQKDWLRTRHLLNILTRQESFYNVDGLKSFVRESINRDLAEQIAEGVAQDRLLMAGLTNLDFGVFIPVNLGQEFAMGVERDDWSRAVDVMLGSSAIPGGFPPVEIEGGLYVDGGAVTQMFVPVSRASMYSPEFLAIQRYGEQQPKIRIWAIVNNKLSITPKTTQPQLGGVLGRSLGIALRASAAMELRDIETFAMLMNARGADVEFRYLAVPEEFADNPSGEFFDQDTMSRLGELGKRLGRDPSSWRVHVPSLEWPQEFFDGTGFKNEQQLRELTEQEQKRAIDRRQ